MLTNNPRIVTEGIVGAWDAVMPNTATAATKLYDAVGSADGTMYNGSCLDVDGTNDYVINSSFTDHQSSSGTIVVWANADSLTGGTYVFGVGGTATYGGSRAMRFYLNKLSLVGYGGATEDYNDFGPTLVTGQWYHVAYVWSGTSVTGYVDGVGYSTTLSGLVTPTGTRVTAGEAPWDGGYFNGQVADARMYNVALSAANIKELYDDSKVIIPYGVSQTNLKCWWPMIDGAGTIAYDGSGNGKDGTLTNMDAATDWLTGQTGCPQLVEGYNRPMLFPGATTEYVAVGNTSEFCFGTSDFSFGAWVKTSNTTTFNMVFDALQPVNKGWQFGVYGTSPYMRLWASTGSAQVNLDSSTNVCDGQWHHVGFTSYAGSPKLVTIYVDGSADTSSGSMGALNMVGGAYASWIGGQVAGPNYPFDGLINEVVLYDALLSSSEMAALAATGPNGGPLPPDPMSGASNLSAASNVKGYWRNDGDVTWTDRSGEGNNGTVGGSPDDLLFKQGYNGQKSTSTGRDGQGFPLKFKNVGALGMQLGVDDSVNLGSAPAFAQIANPGAATIGTWIRVDSASDLNALMGPWVGTSNAGWGIFTNYVGGINMIVDDGADPSGHYVGQNTPKVVVPADGYFHYVVLTVVRNGVGSDASVSYYLDGVFYNTVTFSNENGANAWGSGGTTVFKLGNMNGNTNYFNGQIGNLQMYNKVLTSAQIKQNFNAQRSRFKA